MRWMASTGITSALRQMLSSSVVRVEGSCLSMVMLVSRNSRGPVGGQRAGQEGADRQFANVVTGQRSGQHVALVAAGDVQHMTTGLVQAVGTQGDTWLGLARRAHRQRRGIGGQRQVEFAAIGEQRGGMAIAPHAE